MYDVDHLLIAVLDTLFGFFGRGVCAGVEVLVADSNFLTVDLVYSIVLFNEVEGIRDDLVTCNDVLFKRNHRFLSRIDETNAIEVRWGRMSIVLPCR